MIQVLAEPPRLPFMVTLVENDVVVRRAQFWIQPGHPCERGGEPAWKDHLQAVLDRERRVSARRGRAGEKVRASKDRAALPSEGGEEEFCGCAQ